ncbi:DUF5996 family protein [Actinomadura atramentaria]|uniref:DUF5996 family protein n=1 Tax=Actinomadura atramentaria TaxID=1990 RepID=UPI00036E2414|nr:DUF5996 family protein [Actinomadura atramentaria]
MTGPDTPPVPPAPPGGGAGAAITAGAGPATEPFPSIPLDEWRAAKDTFHRFAQIVGKVRLACSVRRNHWWNVPFHLTGRGLTTRPMGGPGTPWPLFCVDFDLVSHDLVVDRLDGTRVRISLPGRSVASLHAAFFDALHALGVRPAIDARPYGLDDGTPFADDTRHADYEPARINRYFRVLAQVAQVLERHAADFCGKTSPVHHFWHTFDLAVTRFTGRPAPVDAAAGPVAREAYSHEVISSGFWFGDDERPWPAFYSYTAPEPRGLADEPLWPDWAGWVESGNGHLAVLKYDDARTTDDPVATILGFLDSAYRAGARRSATDTGRFASPGGVTDPHLSPD